MTNVCQAACEFDGKQLSSQCGMNLKSTFNAQPGKQGLTVIEIDCQGIYHFLFMCAQQLVALKCKKRNGYIFPLHFYLLWQLAETEERERRERKVFPPFHKLCISMQIIHSSRS